MGAYCELGFGSLHWGRQPIGSSPLGMSDVGFPAAFGFRSADFHDGAHRVGLRQLGRVHGLSSFRLFEILGGHAGLRSLAFASKAPLNCKPEAARGELGEGMRYEFRT